MESYTRFSTVEEFNGYVSPVNHIALTDDTQEVHLKDGRSFKYVVHAYYTISSAVNSRIIGNSCNLNEVARIRIVNSEGKYTYLNATRFYEFPKAGNYRIDYGLFDSTSTPGYLLDGDAAGTNNNNGINLHLIYVQIDPEVTSCGSGFISNAANLTGAIFGNLDEYPEELVFEEPYDRNDLIIGDHVITVGSTLGKNCPKIRNVYIGNNVTTVGNILGYTNNQSVYTVVYVGKSILLGEDPPVRFNPCYLSKIRKYIVNPENPYYIYDETTRCLLDKVKYNEDGIKLIVCGSNGQNDEGYLYVPSEYIIENYATFRGRWGLKIVNLKDYNHKSQSQYRTQGQVICFPGFIDCSSVKLFVMPKNVEFINRFSGGTSNCNLIFFTKEPPIVDWGGDWDPFPGSSGNVYDYSFLRAGDNSGSVNPDSQLSIYVLKGTQEQLNLWTNTYDESYTDENYKNRYNTKNYWGSERPNRWKAAISDWNVIPEGIRNDKNHTAYNGMSLYFKTEDELNKIVDDYINKVVWIDEEFKRVALETFNNGEEMTQELLSAITETDFTDNFTLKNNTIVRSIADFYKFTNVHRIPPSCFENCTSLGLKNPEDITDNSKTVSIKNSIYNIGSRAFSGCSNISSLSINGNTWYGTGVGWKWNRNLDPEGPQSFGGMTSVEGDLLINTLWIDGNNIDYEFTDLGKNGSGIKLVFEPKYRVFGSWFKNAKIISMASSYANLEEGKIKIPSGITTIKKEAFAGVGALTPNLEIIFPESVKIINSAFGGDRAETRYKSIEFGTGIETITGPVFDNNVSNCIIKCRAENPPTLGLGGIGQNINNSELQFPFMNSNFITAIYVPDDSVNLYKTNSNIVTACDYNSENYSTSSELEIGWSRFANIIKPLSEID